MLRIKISAANAQQPGCFALTMFVMSDFLIIVQVTTEGIGKLSSSLSCWKGNPMCNKHKYQIRLGISFCHPTELHPGISIMRLGGGENSHFEFGSQLHFPNCVVYRSRIATNHCIRP